MSRCAPPGVSQASPRAFFGGPGQWNAGSGTFSSTLRLLGEWAPGSEIFLVYTEDRDTDVLGRRTELSSPGTP